MTTTTVCAGAGTWPADALPVAELGPALAGVVPPDPGDDDASSPPVSADEHPAARSITTPRASPARLAVRFMADSLPACVEWLSRLEITSGGDRCN